MLKIHGVPISVHARKAIVTALTKGVPFENPPVIPFDPPEGWRDLSPAGTVPALEDGDYRIADSNAICAFLERLAPEPALYPADAKALGEALWLEQFATTVLFREVIHPLFFQKVIGPNILQQGPVDEGEVARIVEQAAPPVFDYPEAQLKGAFFGGSHPCIADIAIMSNLLNYHYLGFRLDRARHPKLAAQFSAMLSWAPVAQALTAEAPFAEQMGLDRSFLF
ncbi:MAG: hypothetical protein TEF_16720 [Rhizobiales bacterium NRL2]|jgi:glutathione S-transferase|nr:MAG: hypothetical protein TEF_16720 [Rhizobiales bacterium NRL2]